MRFEDQFLSETAPSGDTVYECRWCSAGFLDEGDADDHMSKVHQLVPTDSRRVPDEPLVRMAGEETPVPLNMAARTLGMQSAELRPVDLDGVERLHELIRRGMAEARKLNLTSFHFKSFVDAWVEEHEAWTRKRNRR